jgi:SSS family solute:Na+ symporter
VLPDWATGFFAATIFGAILSSFNSFLNSGSTLFAVDIYHGLLNRNASDQQAVRAGKIFAVLTIPLSVVLVVFFKSYGQQGLFDLLIQYISVTNIPMITIVLVAMLSKRTPAIAVMVALIAGMAFQLFFGILNGGNLGVTIGDTFYGWKMHGLHLAGVNFVFLLLIMLVFRILMPQPVPFEQKYSGDIDITPWKMAKPIGFGLVIIIAAIYLSMWSRFGLTPGAKVAAEYEAQHPKLSPPK